VAIHDQWSCPPRWVVYGGPFTPWFAKLAESWPELGHLWFWGWTPIVGRTDPTGFSGKADTAG